MVYLKQLKRITFFLSLFASFWIQGQVDTATGNADSLVHKGIWVSGLEGGMSTTKLDNNSANKLSDKGFSYIFNFNTGIFIQNNLAFGLNLKFTNTSKTYNTFFSKEELVYFGPWARYYFKFQHNWYVYPELGISYVGFYSETVSTIDNEALITNGSGPGINPGIGLVYFVSKNAAFTIRWNYQVNMLTGESESINQLGRVTTPIDDVLYANSSLLFGFQLYIDEFFF
jgi:hypothetical protein